MKKLLFAVTFILISSVCAAENLQGGVIETEYSDYFEMLDLNAKQYEQVLKIRNEENFVLRPIILEVYSKERGLEFLNTLECDMFDKVCKKRLKEDIEQVQFEQNELMRKIEQKKNYYDIRYRNVLTREQNIRLDEIIKTRKHREKVMAERLERQRRQERINKLKIWENENLKIWKNDRYKFWQNESLKFWKNERFRIWEDERYKFWRNFFQK